MTWPHSITKCIHCQSGKLNPLQGYDRAHLVKCKHCGLVFSAMDPGPEELNRYYSSYGVAQPLPPLTIKRYEALLKSWEPYREQNKILDVGCGIGHFLDIARTAGWEVYGTELSEGTYSICKAKGIEIHLGKIEDAPFQEGMFDVIISIEVIEHINHPGADLNAICRMLRPGGLFYVTTPNFNALSRRLIGSDYNVIHYPEHLTYYTPATLRRVVEAHGFTCKAIKTTGINVARIKNSRRKQEQPQDPSEVKVKAQVPADPENFRTMLEENRILRFTKNAINTMLTLTRLGDAMKGTFIKPG